MARRRAPRGRHNLPLRMARRQWLAAAPCVRCNPEGAPGRCERCASASEGRRGGSCGIRAATDGLPISSRKNMGRCQMERRAFLSAAAATAAAFATKPAAADELPWGNLPGWRYPDTRVEALDKRFKYKVGNAAIERIATGFRWAEGPVYGRDGGYLLWSDIPNNRIMRWLEEDGHFSVFRQPSNYTNGNTRGREGPRITREHHARPLTRPGHDRSITV